MNKKYEKKLFMFIILLFFSTSLIASPNKDLTKRQLLCPKLLWGFDFFLQIKLRLLVQILTIKLK